MPYKEKLEHWVLIRLIFIFNQSIAFKGAFKVDVDNNRDFNKTENLKELVLIRLIFISN